MLKICRNPLCKPLELIFNNFLANGIFPFNWKKGNIVALVHKKNDKQRLNNYRPMSLLPICSKILHRLIFNEMYSLLKTTYRKCRNLVRTKKLLFSRVRTIIRIKKIITKKSAHWIRVHQNYFHKQVRTNI